MEMLQGASCISLRLIMQAMKIITILKKKEEHYNDEHFGNN